MMRNPSVISKGFDSVHGLIPFKRYLTDRCGLYFRDSDRKTLMAALEARMNACRFSDPDDYFRYLTDSPRGEDEFCHLLNLLTVHHTFFFRNGSHFHALRYKILPEIIKLKRKNSSNCRPSIRILSAGCSTGEEPYTIAMVIRETIRDPDEWDIEIHATDISTMAIEKARAGVYRRNSIKQMDMDYLNRYFLKIPGKEDRFAVQDSLKRMVRFEHHNLRSDGVPHGYDIIFCRNVFIYFHLETMLEIVNKLHSSLLDPGYLFVGHSESLQFLTDRFQMEIWEGGIYYRRVAGGTEDRLDPGPVPGGEPAVVDHIVSDLSRQELEADRRLKGGAIEKAPITPDERLVRIMECVHVKDYDGALTLIRTADEREKSAVEMRYLTAEIYANRGEFERAEEELNTILADDPFFAPAHYLMGSVYFEKEDLGRAGTSLKKALYIDGDFSMARFLLSIVYKSEGRVDMALREFRNTLKCVDSYSPEEVIAYSGGFNAVALAGICRENIERLSSQP